MLQCTDTDRTHTVGGYIAKCYIIVCAQHSEDIISRIPKPTNSWKSGAGVSEMQHNTCIVHINWWLIHTCASHSNTTYRRPRHINWHLFNGTMQPLFIIRDARLTKLMYCVHISVHWRTQYYNHAVWLIKVGPINLFSCIIHNNNNNNIIMSHIHPNNWNVKFNGLLKVTTGN